MRHGRELLLPRNAMLPNESKFWSVRSIEASGTHNSVKIGYLPPVCAYNSTLSDTFDRGKIDIHIRLLQSFDKRESLSTR